MSRAVQCVAVCRMDELYDHQRAFVEADTDKYLQGARQTGKSTALMADALGVARELEPTDTVLVFADRHAQLESIRRCLLDLLPENSEVVVNTRTSVELYGGASIAFRTPHMMDNLLRKPEDMPEYACIDEPEWMGYSDLSDLLEPFRAHDVPIAAAGSPHPSWTTFDAIAEAKATDVVWATIWDNPEVDEDFVSEYRQKLSIEKELAEVYGVTPPDAENRGERRD